MWVKTRRIGVVWIVEVRGQVQGGDGVQIATACREVLSAGGRSVVINLLRVPWIGSEGLGEIVCCHKAIVARGGRLKVILRGKTHGLFTVCALQKVLALHENLEEALAGFAIEPPPAMVGGLDRPSIA